MCRRSRPMPKDNGGYVSKGVQACCKKCGNDDATLITSVIYGKKSKVLYCEICSASWPDDDDRD